MDKRQGRVKGYHPSNIHRLSPMLQTIQPGTGSTVIHVPSSMPSCRFVAPGFSTARNWWGRNTCSAPRVGSVHKKLPESQMQSVSEDALDNRSTLREAPVVSDRENGLRHQGKSDGFKSYL